MIKTQDTIWYDISLCVQKLGIITENVTAYGFQLMTALVWPVATYGCERWVLRKNEETRLDALQMKGRRKILWVSWTAKKTNEWVLNKAGVKRELLDTVKARKLRKRGRKKEIMQGTMPGACRRGRPCTAWINNNTWTGLPQKSQSEWQKTEINGESMSMVWPTLDRGRLKNRKD